MSEKSVLEMVGGEKHINPHYNIKAEKLEVIGKKDKSKMTEEQIKQKAEAEADKIIIGSGMDRASVVHLKHLLVTMYMQGATEATKELQKQIQIDAEQIRALQKQNGELTDKVKELEAKLENIRYYLDNEIPIEFINEATTIIYKMV